ncbi:MAG: hypothetical protein Q8P18_17420 [Pseudomonadota bacterium]|nr:hypothetical protein [Pseudomonadota bacterium]
MIALFFGMAFAGGLHGGIPVSGVPGIGEPSFLTPATGWTAAVDGGWVRVFVGPTEAAGAEWYDRMLESIGAPPPVLADLAAVTDAAHGDGATLVSFRDGNVAVLVRVQHDARAVADTLRAAIVDDAPALATPTLSAVAGQWRVDAPGAVHLRYTGGRGVPFQRGVFTEPPTEIVVWDALGRATAIMR